jgi:hypothetical protein
LICNSATLRTTDSSSCKRQPYGRQPWLEYPQHKQHQQWVCPRCQLHQQSHCYQLAAAASASSVGGGGQSCWPWGSTNLHTIYSSSSFKLKGVQGWPPLGDTALAGPHVASLHAAEY